MLEFLRESVGARTEALTDGQFFGFGIIALGVGALLVWILVQMVRNYLIDRRLRKHLQGMSHGGLHFEGRKRRWEKR